MASFPFSRSLLFLLCFANCHCQDVGGFRFSRPPTSRLASVLGKSRFGCKTRGLPRSTRRCILQLQHPYFAGIRNRAAVDAICVLRFWGGGGGGGPVR
uniref:Putative secreted protein n=1 Tax=Anopheles darlingi TaxID=43151 RepID=A0A2M4DL33_ANODA